MSAAAASVLAGARSLTAIGEWIADAPRWALRVLGFAPDPLTGRIPVPHPGTVRRLPARVDGDVLDAAIGAFLATRNTLAQEDGLRPIAVDGKTVRGSRTTSTPAIALLAAIQMAHRTLRPHIEVENVETALEIAARGHADTIAARGVVHRLAGQLPHRLHSAPLRPRLYDHVAIAHRRHTTLSRATRTLIDLATTRLRQATVRGRQADP
ncbi:LysR substrate-binding domain-containing protein [Streptomyces kebangsaanensis]|uniref:LysR substrate-binding domain-containing protein n=1 Tax=Streptomyces kebangsaanensis TaxID=864058 RepID=A0ABW6KWR5_9ACTN